jgi:hypothetical protein
MSDGETWEAGFPLTEQTPTTHHPHIMAPRTTKSSKGPGGQGKRKLDFMHEDDDDGEYEVVKADQTGNDSEEEFSKDFSSALAGGSSSRAKDSQEQGYNTDEEEAEIANMMGSKLKQDGMTAVKAHAAKGKGKDKETKGLTGGGSWQSMGASR